MTALKDLRAKVAEWWCECFHGGGHVKRDALGRINWQCLKCGRWSDPVPLDEERSVVDTLIAEESSDE